MDQILHSEQLRHTQKEVDLVNSNMKKLFQLYNNFITIPK